MKLSEIKVGDRIKFRAVTHENGRSETRIVTQIPDPESLVILRRRYFDVSYFGRRPFYVHANEILEHYPAEVKS